MSVSLPPRVVEIRFRKQHEVAVIPAASTIAKLSEIDRAQAVIRSGSACVEAKVAANVTRLQLRTALMLAVGIDDVVVDKRYECEASMDGVI